MSKDKEYEIFLSFSGEKSKQFAYKFKELIENLHLGKVFFSDISIEEGNDWADSINEALETSKVGIVCFTKENRKAPWLFLEYGVFFHKEFKAKQTKENFKLIPLFLDFKPNDWIDNPLNKFNAKSLISDSKSIKEKIISYF